MGHDPLDGDDTWFVDSPAVGAGMQPRPCGEGLRPAAPPGSDDPIAMTFSGGGFRATLAALGAARALADVGSLGDVRYLSSVSGGSVANGIVAVKWPELRSRGYTSDAFDELVIDPAAREVTVVGKLVGLTPKEFDLLALLAHSPRQVFTRRQLLDRVWGSAPEYKDPATVTVHVGRLRQKIERDPDQPRWLITVRGVGYRFEP